MENLKNKKSITESLSMLVMTQQLPVAGQAAPGRAAACTAGSVAPAADG